MVSRNIKVINKKIIMRFNKVRKMLMYNVGSNRYVHAIVKGKNDIWVL